MASMKLFSPSPGMSSFFWALQLWVGLTIVLINSDLVYGQRNESVTQDSTSITYNGNWRSVNESRSIGGVHRIAAGVGASAEYSFTGTAFYFVAAKWPYPIKSNVSMDGRPGIILDLQDHATPERPRTSAATVGAAVIERGVWTNLENARHTVRVTVPVGEQAAVLDGFIITVPGESAVITTTGTTTGTGTTTDTTTDTTPTPEPSVADSITNSETATITSTYTTVEDLSQETQTVVIVEVPVNTADSSNSDGSSSSSGGFNKGLAIGFGVAFGVILIILLVGVIFWIRRRDKLYQERDNGRGPLPPPTRQFVEEARPSTLAGSIRGGYERPPAGSGTATPLTHNNMAGVGSGPLRNSGRRHSYDGTFMRPETQLEPWAEGFTPSASGR